MATPEAGNSIEEIAQIERAKSGVLRFSEVFSKADPELQQVLLFGRAGREIQALFLRIKPMAELNSAEDLRNDRVAELLADDAWYLSKRRRLIDLKQAQTVITANPDIFPDPQLADESIRDYLKRFQFEADTDPKKVGLLFGFPKEAVMQYAEHQARVNEVTLFIEEYYHYDEQIRIDLFDENIGFNQFRDKHREEIRAILRREFPYATPEEVDYLLTARLVDIPGFRYIASGPDPLNSPHVQMVYRVFEESGMNSFVRSAREGHPIDRP